jgi:hypothetical protein
MDLEGVRIPQAPCLIVNVHQYFPRTVKGIINAYLLSPACGSVNLITRSMNIILNDYEHVRLFDKLILKRHGDLKATIEQA